MASAQNSVQNSQTRTVQHNHVIIQYQQPPDPAIVNHVLEILVAITRSYAQKNVVQIPYIQDYLDQIVPFLQTLYSESAQWVLQQGVPPPSSNTIYSPPLMTSQVDREIKIETSNIYSVNKVLLQQILETIGQITSKTLNKNPQQVRKLEPLVLELYRQLTRFLFNLEAEENRRTGQISISPEVWLLVTKIWNHIWKTLEEKK